MCRAIYPTENIISDINTTISEKRTLNELQLIPPDSISERPDEMQTQGNELKEQQNMRKLYLSRNQEKP